MAYPIKATAGASSFPVLRVSTYGNLGVNQGGYGSTAATGFWNGKTPNISGYVVYVGNGTSSPTMYVVANDNELITLSNNLGIGTNYNITGALLAFRGAINMVCVDVEPPNIVTSGLTLCLDAGLAYSYPRSSTTWFDLSDSFNNGTLVNGPVYVFTSGGGSISFDGSDDYVTCGNPVSTQSLTQITMSVWVKFSGLDYVGGTGALNGFMSKGYPDLSSPNTGFWFAYDNRSNGSSFTYTCFGNSNGGFAGGVNNFSSKSYTFTNGIWYNITATVNSSSQGALYINGVQQGSSVTFSNLSIPNTANTLYVGRIDLGYTLNGSIIQTQLYNIALTSAEVLQNYYAGLQRIIPIQGLVLWLDGTNTNTRVITPTTAYDMSGNDYNGTFTNGASLAHIDGGTVFSFDGVNDKIQTTLNTLSSSTTWTIWVKRTQSMGLYNMIMGMFLPYFSSMSDGSIHFSNNIGGFQRSLYAYVGLTDNIWYNITFVSSFSGGNTTMMIYLNGVLQTQATYAGQQPTTTDNSFRLGDWENGGSYPFNGKIGDVRIYSRVLTATEISTIYTAGRSRYGL